MTDRRRRRRPKVVPRAAADFVRQLKIQSFKTVHPKQISLAEARGNERFL